MDLNQTIVGYQLLLLQARLNKLSEYVNKGYQVEAETLIDGSISLVKKIIENYEMECDIK